MVPRTALPSSPPSLDAPRAGEVSRGANPIEQERRSLVVFDVAHDWRNASVLTRLVAYTLFAATTGGAVVLVPTRPATQDAAVDVRTFQFAPDTVRVKAGAAVQWANQDDIEHTVTAGTPEKRDTRFGGLLAKKGSQYSATLKDPGTYPYFCDRHQFMRGVIIVTR
jgi:plastocyanin